MKNKRILSRRFIIKLFLVGINITQISIAQSWLDELIYYNVWDRIRTGFQIPDDERANKVTQKYLTWYTKHPEHLKTVFNNSLPYLEYIVSQVEKHQLPSEIALLPFIESNFDPFAFSAVGATGLWQMMPGTASGYGININWWYDGRRDIVESTDKALNYMNYLGRYFNSNWLIAIAAYDSGEGKVRKAIKRQNNKDSIDFWSLRLPKETRHYLPKLLALKKIIKDPDKYGIKLPKLPNEKKFVVVKIQQQLYLHDIAQLAEVDIKEFRKYNPGFRRNITHPTMVTKVLIPIDKKDIFEENIANKFQEEKQQPKMHRYIVADGDTLGKIAKKFSSTTTKIKDANKLKSDIIYPNTALLIPSNTYVKNVDKLLPVSSLISQDKIPGPQLVIHRVQHGDTIANIAEKYNTDIGKIEFWNNLYPRDKLTVNDEIVIWKKLNKKSRNKYRVKKGDTLSQIATNYKTTSKRLQIINNILGDKIKINQTLKIN